MSVSVAQSARRAKAGKSLQLEARNTLVTADTCCLVVAVVVIVVSVVVVAAVVALLTFGCVDTPLARRGKSN